MGHLPVATPGPAPVSWRSLQACGRSRATGAADSRWLGGGGAARQRRPGVSGVASWPLPRRGAGGDGAHTGSPSGWTKRESKSTGEAPRARTPRRAGSRGADRPCGPGPAPRRDGPARDADARWPLGRLRDQPRPDAVPGRDGPGRVRSGPVRDRGLGVHEVSRARGLLPAPADQDRELRLAATDRGPDPGRLVRARAQPSRSARATRGQRCRGARRPGQRSRLLVGPRGSGRPRALPRLPPRGTPEPGPVVGDAGSRRRIARRAGGSDPRVVGRHRALADRPTRGPCAPGRTGRAQTPPGGRRQHRQEPRARARREAPAPPPDRAGASSWSAGSWDATRRCGPRW